MLDVDSWEEVPTRLEETPQQDNLVDCGVFTCTFANFLSLGLDLRFSAANIPTFRQRMTLELLNKKIDHGS